MDAGTLIKVTAVVAVIAACVRDVESNCRTINFGGG